MADDVRNYVIVIGVRMSLRILTVYIGDVRFVPTRFGQHES